MNYTFYSQGESSGKDYPLAKNMILLYETRCWSPKCMEVKQLNRSLLASQRHGQKSECLYPQAAQQWCQMVRRKVGVDQRQLLPHASSVHGVEFCRMF